MKNESNMNIKQEELRYPEDLGRSMFWVGNDLHFLLKDGELVCKNAYPTSIKYGSLDWESSDSVSGYKKGNKMNTEQRIEIINSDNAKYDTAQINCLLKEGWSLVNNIGEQSIQQRSSFFTVPEYRIIFLERNLK